MNKRTLIAATALTLLGTGAAQAQDRWDWGGGRPGDREYRLIGPGVRMLFPELRRTPRSRAFVMRNFDFNRDGIVSRREADAADRAFAEIAGSDRGRFDWNARGEARGYDGPPPVAVERGHGRWDRRAMHDYGFRQTPRGAMLSLQEDVLFATDSAALRPGAIDKLRPLADYLQDQRGVRIAIDGYTDSRGSDAHNQDLSERRAESVRGALDEMGVTRARFQVTGHGEREPVASNATPAGMRQNRRVEVTLLGQRADEFSRY